MSTNANRLARLPLMRGCPQDHPASRVAAFHRRLSAPQLCLAVSGSRRLAPVADFIYDAMLRNVLLGHFFSMVFGHTPLIIPAVTQMAPPYHPRFYSHLLLLHLGLILPKSASPRGNP